MLPTVIAIAIALYLVCDVSGNTLYSETFQEASPGQNLSTLGFIYPLNNGAIAVVQNTTLGLVFDGRPNGGSSSPDGLVWVDHTIPAPTPGATQETWSLQQYVAAGSVGHEFMVQGNPGAEFRWADIQVTSSGYLFRAFNSSGLVGSSTFAPVLTSRTTTLSIVFDWGVGVMYAQVNGGSAGTSPSFPLVAGAQHSLSVLSIVNDLRSPSTGCIWSALLVQDNATAIIPGDLNSDNSVNLSDYGILKSHWLQSVPTGTSGDLNSDGNVSLADFTLFKSDYLAFNGGSLGSVSEVPEPGTRLLACAALPAACVVWCRRRKWKYCLVEGQTE